MTRASFLLALLASACGGEPSVGIPPGDDGLCSDVCDEADAGVDAPIDVLPCDPVRQIGCFDGERCTWIWDSLDNPATAPIEATVGHSGCAPDNGTVPPLGACLRSGPAFGTGAGAGPGVADDCTKGNFCFDAVCEPICDPESTTALCAGDTVCTTHPGIFIYGGIPASGLCE